MDQSGVGYFPALELNDDCIAKMLIPMEFS